MTTMIEDSADVVVDALCLLHDLATAERIRSVDGTLRLAAGGDRQAESVPRPRTH